MTHARPGSLVRTCTSLLVLLLSVGCGTGDRHPENDRAVWFVQLTDPHFFLDTSKDSDAAEKATREKQEKLDQNAVSDFWKQVPSLSNDRPISFVVVTGDLGVEPCSIADLPAPTPPAKPEPPKAKDCIEKVNKDKRANQITVLADLFGGSPIRDIYLAAGNNDIASEVASDDALDYFNQFMADLQRKIDDSKKNVQLHNLTGCYSAKGGSCSADVAETPYRLIGFPSYSFKNREPGSDTNTALQEKQFETFSAQLDQARQAGKKVLVVSHVPLIDDPFTLAQDRYAAVPPPAAIEKDPKNARSAWSTWNVSKKLSDEWQDAIASDAVAGILAGHLHDSHKEIYRQPYTWSSVNDQKTGFSKLYMAPPLSVKKQDTSPIQARGFSLVGLRPDEIKYQIYWYNAEKGDFTPDQRDAYGKRRSERRWYRWEAMPGGVEYIVACVWKFLCPTTLDQSAILFIALLAAFLTVVQVWQIPEPESPFNVKAVTATAQAAGGSQTASAQASQAKAAFEPSPFASNFGKTVITGLTGLAAETVLKSLEGKPTADDKEYYIVWFVIFFFLLLLGLALFRAVVEAIRSRIAIIYYPLPPRGGSSSGGSGPRSGATPPDDPKGPEQRSTPGRIWDSLTYWALRIGHWLLSLKVPLLTLLDTFINLIQGKNQTNTRVFSDTIIEQQRNVVRVAHTIRRQVHDVILQQLPELHPSKDNPEDKTTAQLTSVTPPQAPVATATEAKTPPPPAPGQSTAHKPTVPRPNPQDIRVNISVLSADQSRLFYIARSPGSSLQSFPKRSVAWVSVFTGKIRWFKRAYQDNDMLSKIVLFDNASGVISDAEQKIYLQSHYQSRDDDYEAFVVFPVPWPQRGYGSQYVKGAIHISFRSQEEFQKIWAIREDSSLTSVPTATATTQSKPELEYRFENKMIEDACSDPLIRATLREAIVVLGELLRGFNENIYFSSPGGGDCPE